MSQVRFKTGIREVMAGWDRPLGHFFLTISSVIDDEVVWSSIYDLPKGGTSSTEPLKKMLREFEVEPPEGFWERVERREGNVLHSFNEMKWKTTFF